MSHAADFSKVFPSRIVDTHRARNGGKSGATRRFTVALSGLETVLSANGLSKRRLGDPRINSEPQEGAGAIVWNVKSAGQGTPFFGFAAGWPTCLSSENAEGKKKSFGF